MVQVLASTHVSSSTSSSSFSAIAAASSFESACFREDDGLGPDDSRGRGGRGLSSEELRRGRAPDPDELARAGGSGGGTSPELGRAAPDREAEDIDALDARSWLGELIETDWFRLSTYT